MSTWSPQQEHAIKEVQAWLDDPNSPQVFRLFGFAGTGKTTLAQELASGVRGRVLYGAYTGKAALVLRKKGCHNASTIHSMIYRPEETDKQWEPKFRLNEESSVRGASLVVIDEASMVGEELGLDLLSFRAKVLVLGDPAQLPPVKDAGFFTEQKPDIMLTEVHRQAAENPIIRLSMDVREGRKLKLGAYGDTKVISRRDVDQQEVLDADQLLVGLNKSRITFNDRIRALKGMPEKMPVVGDKLVCLKNNREKKLLNGSLWEVQEITETKAIGVRMLVTSEDTPETLATDVMVRHEFFQGTYENLSWEQRRFSDEFTFGYALTVHKSQGSQWDNVYLFDESGGFRDHGKRWLYTGITRAAERITIVQ
jgi:exodeoxyribonuclease-5